MGLFKVRYVSKFLQTELIFVKRGLVHVTEYCIHLGILLLIMLGLNHDIELVQMGVETKFVGSLHFLPDVGQRANIVANIDDL